MTVQRGRAFFNGNIHTLDKSAPHATAIGLREGRIVAIGTDAEVREALPGAESVDLRGRTVVPGLIDAHLHFLGLSLALAEVPLTGVPSIAAAVDRATARARSAPAGQWITGGGWNYDVLRD